MFIDDNRFNIRITNIIDRQIDIEKIFIEGYSTKGDNHGYGLSLVKKIIDESKHLNLITEISKDLFSQNVQLILEK